MIAYLYEKEHVTILNTSAWEAKFPEGAVSSRGTTKTTDHTMRTNLLNWFNLVQISKNVVLRLFGGKNLLKGGYPIIFVTATATAADFVYTSETNESCEKHSTKRW